MAGLELGFPGSKGKERKGKVRKGKERKGKERSTPVEDGRVLRNEAPPFPIEGTHASPDPNPAIQLVDDPMPAG